MKWEAPSLVEIKMDSEINSYQDDFREDPDANEPSRTLRSSGVIPKPYGST